MDYSLKGVTRPQIIKDLAQLPNLGIAFDLRPRSLNFTQIHNIEAVLEDSFSNLYEVILLFENEKDFMILDAFQKVQTKIDLLANSTSDKSLNYPKLLVEYTGDTSLALLESYKIPYVWHYNPSEKIIDIEKLKYMQRIVFHHDYFEQLNVNGELFGFCQIFNSLNTNIEHEVQLEWGSSLIESIFDYFSLNRLSYEVNNKVELSYQQTNNPLIISQYNYLMSLQQK